MGHLMQCIWTERSALIATVNMRDAIYQQCAMWSRNLMWITLKNRRLFITESRAAHHNIIVVVVVSWQRHRWCGHYTMTTTAATTTGCCCCSSSNSSIVIVAMQPVDVCLLHITFSCMKPRARNAAICMWIMHISCILCAWVGKAGRRELRALFALPCRIAIKYVWCVFGLRVG